MGPAPFLPVLLLVGIAGAESAPRGFRDTWVFLSSKAPGESGAPGPTETLPVVLTLRAGSFLSLREVAVAERLIEASPPRAESDLLHSTRGSREFSLWDKEARGEDSQQTTGKRRMERRALQFEIIFGFFPLSSANYSVLGEALKATQKKKSRNGTAGREAVFLKPRQFIWC